MDDKIINIVMRPVSPVERSRVYTFPGGDQVEIKGVSGIYVRESGSHRLNTEDGLRHIVAAGWLHIEIDAEGWSL